MNYFLAIRSDSKPKCNNSVFCDQPNMDLAFRRLRLPVSIRQVVAGWVKDAKPGMMMTVKLPKETKDTDNLSFQIFSLADGPPEQTYQSFETKPAVEVIPYDGRPCQLIGADLSGLATKAQKPNDDEDEDEREEG